MRSAAIALLLLAGIAFPLVVGYHLDPVKSLWSGWTPSEFPNNYVSQVLTCNFDELDTAAGGYVELFVGDYHDTTSFNLNVYEYPDGVAAVASALGQHPTRGHTWLRFPVVTASGQSFTKGKQYEFKFTRSGNDSVNYYYQGGNPYQYGHMRVGGTDETGKDLCCRVYSRLNAVDSTYWAVDQWNFVPWGANNPGGDRSRLRHEGAQLADSAGVGSMMILRGAESIGQLVTPPRT